MDKVQQAFALQQSAQTSPAQLQEANKWLEHFQGTTEAWQVVDQLLRQPAENGTASAAHVFAAQTMRTKIQYDWAELPAQSHESLRSSLLEHVIRFGQGPQPVLTQLCLAIATLALHMDSWQTVVPDLIRALTTPPEEATSKLPCLLELLTVLPEEAENFKVGVMPSRRDEFRKGLNHSGEQVLALLGQVCSQCTGQEKILNNLLKCIASWLRQGSLPSKHLSASPLLTFAFGAMTSPLFFDNAADMLIELVHYTHDYEVHGPLIAEIVPQVLQLVPQFDAALQQEDEDRARALCRLFTEMAEQYLQLLIVQQPDWAMQTAQAVLRGAFHPEPDIAEITFNFWYMLSEEIHGSGRTLTDAQRTECRARFADVFLRLLEALRGLAEYPAESAEWPADQKDDFIRFRYTVGDAISDACKVLSAKRCIESGFEALQQRLQPFAQQPAQLWRGVEACVYCLRQMNSNHDPTFFSADIVGQFMRLIPTLPAVGELQNTCIRTIGTYANYLSRNAEMLPPLLQYVSQGLTQPESAAAASQAMKHLCDACAEHLADEQTMAMLLLMYHGTLQLELKNADRVDLISALAFVISQMALPQVLPAMQAVAQPILEKLQGGLASGASGGDVSNCLDLLCGLLRDVKPNQQVNSDLPLLQDAPHPSVQMIESLWEVLELVYVRHSTDSRVMERLCRCYKQTSRNVGVGFKRLVPRLLPQVTGWFEQQQHSCFLYVLNVCVGGYGDDPQLLPIFSEAFRRMSTVTFALLQQSIPNNPDVVDDVFELGTKVLKRQPSMLLETELIGTYFQCGCAALNISHREAGRSVVSFFDNLMILGTARGARMLPAGALAGFQKVLTEQGAQLVSTIVLAVAGLVPASRLRFLVPVLKCIADGDAGTCRKWVEAALQRLPSDAHVDGATLLSALFSQEALADDRAFFLVVEAFSSACRRKRIPERLGPSL